MVNVRITVVKKMANKDLVDRYGKDIRAPCPIFKVGDSFIVKELNMPDKFCSWAWADIHRDVALLALGGNHYWNNEKGVAIVCCTDGFRPVVFKIERIEE